MRSIAVFFALTLTVAAQEYRATLSGRITDPQGAVVPQDKIVATQVDTGSKFETVSGSDGLYTIPFLPSSGWWPRPRGSRNTIGAVCNWARMSA